MITVSRCRDRLRKRRAPTLSLTAWLIHRAKPTDPTPEPEHSAETSELRSKVWEAVQKLTPMLREAIVLRHWGGHTYQEISDITGCPMKTAQSRVRLAHQRLAKTLAETDLIDLIEEV
jgi:RNA polymerase sigma factor (sigma-70 family)